MPNRITVTVNYLLRPGMEVIGHQMLRDFITINKKQPGCLEIQLHKDAKKPAAFLSISVWESKEAFHALLTEPHIKEYATKSQQLLAEPFAVRIWEKAE